MTDRQETMHGVKRISALMSLSGQSDTRWIVHPVSDVI